MIDLWTLGGLSWRELFKRTLRESWEDDVFGQAARLAFYHFLAVFPALLLASAILQRFPGTGSDLLRTLQTSLTTILPARASQTLTGVLGEIGGRAAERTIWFALIGSLWAFLNGTWAVMSGLNAAYEVKEQRRWWSLTLTAIALTLALALLVFTSLVVLFYGQRVGELVIGWTSIPAGLPIAWPLVHWPILAIMLLTAFALLYRFGPSLPDRELRWSTPGAVIAVTLWLTTSALFRAYIDFQESKYEQVYGSAGALAILLLWLYFTGAAILIGGEVNSEIENAAAQHGHPDANRPGDHRDGGVPARRV